MTEPSSAARTRSPEDGPLAVIGGPLGSHASVRARSWLATVSPLLVLSSAMVGLGVAQRGHCVANGWNGTEQFWRGCFSDLPALYRIGNLDAGLGGYLSTGADAAAVDHPVLTGAVMSLVGGLVPAGSVLDQTRWYFLLWAVLAAVLVAATVYLTAATRPRHAGDAAIVAASPMLVIAPLVSADVFGVALVAAGLWAWSRRQPLLAGALLGLAVTARTYPLLILLALVLLGLRSGRLPAVGRALAGAGVAIVLVLFPFAGGQPRCHHRAVCRVVGQRCRPRVRVDGSPAPRPPPPGRGRHRPRGRRARGRGCRGRPVRAGHPPAPDGGRGVLRARRAGPRGGQELPGAGVAVAAAAGRAVRAALARPPGLGGRRGDALRRGLALRGRHEQARPRPARPAGMPCSSSLRVAAVLYLVWRVWHTAAQRPPASSRGARRAAPSLEQDRGRAGRRIVPRTRRRRPPAPDASTPHG